MIYLISDMHFNHNNVISFEKRPFIDVNAVNDEMIDAWNSTVNETDTVIIMGDMSLASPSKTSDIIIRLKGKKVLVRGNHDQDKIADYLTKLGLIDEVHDVGFHKKYGAIHFYFSHYPMEIGNRPNMVNVHGHIHSEPSKYANQFNVGVDSILMKRYYSSKGKPFGTPVPLDYVIKLAENYNKMHYPNKSK